jgi:hypothetical protein
MPSRVQFNLGAIARLRKSERFERRGTMVYTADVRPGKAQCVAECDTIEQAERLADALNDIQGFR